MCFDASDCLQDLDDKYEKNAYKNVGLSVQGPLLWTVFTVHKCVLMSTLIYSSMSEYGIQ